jgi:hypothetical protein
MLNKKDFKHDPNSVDIIFITEKSTPTDHYIYSDEYKEYLENLAKREMSFPVKNIRHHQGDHLRKPEYFLQLLKTCEANHTIIFVSSVNSAPFYLIPNHNDFDELSKDLTNIENSFDEMTVWYLLYYWRSEPCIFHGLDGQVVRVNEKGMVVKLPDFDNIYNFNNYNPAHDEIVDIIYVPYNLPSYCAKAKIREGQARAEFPFELIGTTHFRHILYSSIDEPECLYNLLKKCIPENTILCFENYEDDRYTLYLCDQEEYSELCSDLENYAKQDGIISSLDFLNTFFCYG